MHREPNKSSFPYEDVLAACVALIAVVVCAVALFGAPSARGVGYDSFVRAQPVPEVPVPAPVEHDDGFRVAGETVTAGDAGATHASDLSGATRVCSPDTRAELMRLLDICNS